MRRGGHSGMIQCPHGSRRQPLRTVELKLKAPENLVKTDGIKRQGSGVRAVVLDRDGTLVRHIPYLSSPDKVELLPGVVEGVALLLEASCELFLHTNQSGVTRGLLTIEDVHRCNDALDARLGFGSSVFRRVCVAPELVGGPDTYRKPSPRFALEVLDELGLRAAELAYVGDSASDLLAASACGALGVGVNTGLVDLWDALRESGLEGQFPVFERFIDAARYLVAVPEGAVRD